MSNPKIRPIALCLFRHEGKILVAKGSDPIKGDFYRPLGGGIEFGELSSQTVVREIAEELGAVVENSEYLFTLENVFTYQEKPHHEIVFIHDGKFADQSLYQCQEIIGCEADGEEIRAVWRSLDEFGEGLPPLYPTQLLEKLLG